MTDPTKPALGLSVGATTLTAVTADRTVTRKPADLRRPGRRPGGHRRAGRLGAPRGDFAGRGAAGAGLRRHRGPAAARGHRVTHPAHWRPGAVEALRRALRRIPEWAADGAAADRRHRRRGDRAAGRSRPAHPRGDRAVRLRRQRNLDHACSTPAGGYRPIAPTVRHLDFSGDLIDQGLLAHVVAELSAGGPLDVTGTSAIGSLTRLRAECRAAKERLSTVTVTAVPADLPGFRGDVRLTRAELDDTVQPLTGRPGGRCAGHPGPRRGPSRRAGRGGLDRRRRRDSGGHHDDVGAPAGACHHHARGRPPPRRSARRCGSRADRPTTTPPRWRPRRRTPPSSARDRPGAGLVRGRRRPRLWRPRCASRRRWSARAPCSTSNPRPPNRPTTPCRGTAGRCRWSARRCW